MTFSDPGDDIPASSFVKVDCTAKRKRMVIGQSKSSEKLRYGTVLQFGNCVCGGVS